MKDLIWIEISKSKLKNNLETIRKIVGKNVLISPCVKANAYGHGLIEISKLLNKYKTDWLSINSIGELETLRKNGIKKPILIMSQIQKDDLNKIVKLNAKIFLYDKKHADELSKFAQKTKKHISAHIKVDTGMGRQGVAIADAENFINYVSGLKNIKIEGIATHFSSSDKVLDKSCFKKQLQNFETLLKKLEKEKLKIPIVHCANSGAILLHKNSYFNLVRPGISIYGYYPSEETEKICLRKKIKLLPVLSLKTKVVSIKELPPSSCVSYGCTFKTKKKTRIAILPIGYYDGIDRKLSNKGYVLIKGQKAKILGVVCMNMTMVDITNIKDVECGDETIVIGEQGKEKITADDMAKIIGTINYEVTTRLRESIPKHYTA